MVDTPERANRGLPAPIRHAGHLISFQPAADADEAFMCRVYASTRAAELAQTNWTDQQKAAFTRMQFEAQHADYRRKMPNAVYGIVSIDEQPAGRLILYRTQTELQVVDIALLPEFRNAGAGGATLRYLQAEAAEKRQRLTVYVEKFNPALRLYARLGFVPIDDLGVYLFMEWKSGRRS